MNNVWPISDNIDDFDFGKTFSVIEYLHECVSKPGWQNYHNWNNCGWHSGDYDWELGQERYREEVNGILNDFGPGYELNENGEILEFAPNGLELMLEDLDETDDPENIDNRVKTAIGKFRKYNATLDDKKDAIIILAGVLEFLKKQNIKLPRKDDAALFNIFNNFDIRHHNQAQKGQYDREIWFDWVFYTSLASINVLLKSQKPP